eukprot:23569-Karenia_brevis.AAC.1
MNAKLTQWWRDTGAKIIFTGAAQRLDNRAMAVGLGKRGPRKGLYLATAYAPTCHDRAAVMRKFDKELEKVVDSCPSYHRVFLGGDFNAE